MSLSNSPIPLSDLRTNLDMVGISLENIAAVLQAAREFSDIVMETNVERGCQNVTVDAGLLCPTDRTPLDSKTPLDLSSPEMQAFRVRCREIVGAIQGEERRRISLVLNNLGASSPGIALFHTLFSDLLGSGDRDPFGATHRRVFDLDEHQISQSQDFLQESLFTLNSSAITQGLQAVDGLLKEVIQSGLAEKVNFLRREGLPSETEAFIVAHGMRETLDRWYAQMRAVATNLYVELAPVFSARFSRPGEENDFSAQDAVLIRQVMHSLHSFGYMFLQKIAMELPPEENSKLFIFCWTRILSSITSALSLQFITENFEVTIANAHPDGEEIPEAFSTQFNGIQERSGESLSPVGSNITNLINHSMRHAVGWSSQAYKTQWLLDHAKANSTKTEDTETLSTPLGSRLEFTAVIPGLACIYSSVPPDACSGERKETFQNFTYAGNEDPYAPLTQESFNVEKGGLTMHRFGNDSGFGTGRLQFIDAETILGDDHPIIEVGHRVHETLQKMRKHILAEEDSPLARFPDLRNALEESTIPVRYVVFNMGDGTRDDSLIFTDAEARTLGIDHCQNCTTPDDEDMASLLGLKIPIPSPNKDELRCFSLNPDEGEGDGDRTKPDDPNRSKKLPRRGFARSFIPVLEA